MTWSLKLRCGYCRRSKLVRSWRLVKSVRLAFDSARKFVRVRVRLTRPAAARSLSHLKYFYSPPSSNLQVELLPLIEVAQSDLALALTTPALMGRVSLYKDYYEKRPFRYSGLYQHSCNNSSTMTGTVAVTNSITPEFSLEVKLVLKFPLTTEAITIRSSYTNWSCEIFPAQLYKNIRRSNGPLKKFQRSSEFTLYRVTCWGSHVGTGRVIRYITDPLQAF